MSAYKITNVTNLVGKREPKFNSTVKIDYVDGMTKKSMSVKPGETIYITIPQLPLSVQNLRIGGFLDILEISEKQLSAAMKPIVKTPTISKQEDLLPIAIEEPTTFVKKKIKAETTLPPEENN